MDSHEPITDAELARLCRDVALTVRQVAGAAADFYYDRDVSSDLDYNAALGAHKLAEERLTQAIRMLALERTDQGG